MTALPSRGHLPLRLTPPLIEVSILFPYLQVAALVVVLLLLVTLSVSPPGLGLLYIGVLLLWYVRVTTRLFLNSWRDFRLCSQESAMALASAGWHALISFQLGIEIAGVIAVLLLITIALYGVVCHGRD